jgi:hypothetical protein
MSSIQKDSKAFPYIIDIWDQIKNFDNSLYKTIKESIVPKKMFKLYYVPKYDGSLFNLTFINKSNIVYPIIDALLTDLQNKENILSTSYYYKENGVFLLGSKGTVLSKDPVNKRIHNAIEGSYGSVDAFLQIAHDYVNNEQLFDSHNVIINLHFEAIDAIPSDELTVYYGRAWCPFFGITTYNSIDCKKTFILPISEYIGNFLSVANIYDCDADWLKLRNIYKSNYDKLLDGDQDIEPEGYVLHIITEDGEWIPIKDKYELYYTAHKPSSKNNLKMALELSSNPKYKLICERFAKFRYKPSIKDILSLDLVDIINDIKQTILLTTSLSETTTSTNLDTSVYLSKKKWACYWKNKTNINILQEKFTQIKDNLVPYYNQFKDLDIEKRIFPFLMKLYEKLSLDKSIDQLINITDDQLIDLISNFLS